ncbi:alpha/beta fold hydrolase [Phenylobacterium sp.]|uniref:alpha/beta fold hydrolase n=1 Tax=Phenylobacterium sp. TaxID=1871053 RepID=UPI002737577C|nr:alpha/beta hydrolase [Phenylobacterium sp.]MDP3658603.1 alpha/beta hydrolase [Phenylobacterium sp.]
MPNPLNIIGAGVLDVAYETHGPADGQAAVLLHGFPYDVRCYDAVAPLLAAQGMRVITPYLRGYGATRFVEASTPRSGEQAVLGMDLLALLNALGIGRAVLAGYDWGGRAACVVAALWPERVAGLVSGTGYNIQDIAASVRPEPPEAEARYWYQYYLHGERGREGLTQNRGAFARLLWRMWSPDWAFDEATFARTAASFDNPDFVEVVVHSYRHRFGLVAGDPAAADVERRLAARPSIGVPTINLHGAGDGVGPPAAVDAALKRFTGPYERRLLDGVGHNIPQEAPRAFAEAVLALAAA